MQNFGNDIEDRFLSDDSFSWIDHTVLHFPELQAIIPEIEKKPDVGFKVFDRLVQQNNLLSIKFLLNQLSPNVREGFAGKFDRNYGNTELHHAVAAGKIGLVQILLECGASQNPNYLRQHPLHVLAQMQPEDSAGIAELLIRSGENQELNICDSNDATPFRIFLNHPQPDLELAAVFLRHNAPLAQFSIINNFFGNSDFYLELANKNEEPEKKLCIFLSMYIAGYKDKAIDEIKKLNIFNNSQAISLIFEILLTHNDRKNITSIYEKLPSIDRTKYAKIYEVMEENRRRPLLDLLTESNDVPLWVMEICAKRGDIKLIKKIREVNISDITNMLKIAAKFGHINLIRLYVEYISSRLRLPDQIIAKVVVQLLSEFPHLWFNNELKDIVNRCLANINLSCSSPDKDIIESSSLSFIRMYLWHKSQRNELNVEIITYFLYSFKHRNVGLSILLLEILLGDEQQSRDYDNLENVLVNLVIKLETPKKLIALLDFLKYPQINSDGLNVFDKPELLWLEFCVRYRKSVDGYFILPICMKLLDVATSNINLLSKDQVNLIFEMSIFEKVNYKTFLESLAERLTNQPNDEFTEVFEKYAEKIAQYYSDQDFFHTMNNHFELKAKIFYLPYLEKLDESTIKRNIVFLIKGITKETTDGELQAIFKYVNQHLQYVHIDHYYRLIDLLIARCLPFQDRTREYPFQDSRSTLAGKKLQQLLVIRDNPQNEALRVEFLQEEIPPECFSYRFFYSFYVELFSEDFSFFKYKRYIRESDYSKVLKKLTNRGFQKKHLELFDIANPIHHKIIELINLQEISDLSLGTLLTFFNNRIPDDCFGFSIFRKTYIEILCRIHRELSAEDKASVLNESLYLENLVKVLNNSSAEEIRIEDATTIFSLMLVTNVNISGHQKSLFELFQWLHVHKVALDFSSAKAKSIFTQLMWYFDNDPTSITRLLEFGLPYQDNLVGSIIDLFRHPHIYFKDSALKNKFAQFLLSPNLENEIPDNFFRDLRFEYFLLINQYHNNDGKYELAGRFLKIAIVHGQLNVYLKHVFDPKARYLEAIPQVLEYLNYLIQKRLSKKLDTEMLTHFCLQVMEFVLRHSSQLHESLLQNCRFLMIKICNESNVETSAILSLINQTEGDQIKHEFFSMLANNRDLSSIPESDFERSSVQAFMRDVISAVNEGKDAEPNSNAFQFMTSFLSKNCIKNFLSSSHRLFEIINNTSQDVAVRLEVSCIQTLLSILDLQRSGYIVEEDASKEDSRSKIIKTLYDFFTSERMQPAFLLNTNLVAEEQMRPSLLRDPSSANSNRLEFAQKIREFAQMRQTSHQHQRENFFVILADMVLLGEIAIMSSELEEQAQSYFDKDWVGEEIIPAMDPEIKAMILVTRGVLAYLHLRNIPNLHDNPRLTNILGLIRRYFSGADGVNASSKMLHPYAIHLLTIFCPDSVFLRVDNAVEKAQQFFSKVNNRLNETLLNQVQASLNESNPPVLNELPYPITELITENERLKARIAELERQQAATATIAILGNAQAVVAAEKPESAENRQEAMEVEMSEAEESIQASVENSNLRRSGEHRMCFFPPSANQQMPNSDEEQAKAAPTASKAFS